MATPIDDLNRVTTLQDRDYFSYTKDENDKIAKRVAGTVNSIAVSQFGEYDELQVTYPTTLTELYTFKLATVSLGTTLVTYQDTAKCILISVVHNEL